MNNEKLKFLIFGDIFGSLGRQTIKENCARLKKKYKPDLTIANAENMTHGSGMSAKTIDEMMEAGVEFFTGGNHSFDNRKAFELFNIENIPVIRPANLASNLPGEGFQILEIGGQKIVIANLIGRLFMKNEYANPFAEIDQILKKVGRVSSVIVDFHGEATSEKAAMAHYLDGKVSLVFGTHTHIQTADERVLEKGTGFISDIGFVGPLDSIIGMEVEATVKQFRYPEQKTKTIICESGPKILNAIYVEVKDEKCVKIERISETFDH